MTPSPSPSAFPAAGFPIVGAGTRGDILSQSRQLPSMRGTLSGWFRPMTVEITRQRIVDGENKPFDSKVSGSGVIQPQSNEELKLKPEGDRSWKWVMLHCTEQIILQTNDDVQIGVVKFKVMGKKDYTEYGYLRYELIETYRP